MSFHEGNARRPPCWIVSWGMLLSAAVEPRVGECLKAQLLAETWPPRSPPTPSTPWCPERLVATHRNPRGTRWRLSLNALIPTRGPATRVQHQPRGYSRASARGEGGCSLPSRESTVASQQRLTASVMKASSAVSPARVDRVQLAKKSVKQQQRVNRGEQPEGFIWTA